MSDPIYIDIDDTAVITALNRLAAACADPGPVLKEIGESLIESTKRRFETSTAPDGSAWAPNSPVTILKYLRGKSGATRRDGRLSAKGAALVMAKKPLIGDSKDLGRQFSYSVDGSTLTVFSSIPYSAMQQFGGTKAKFPNLWGDIPARPFMGISDDDRAMIERSILSYLEASF